jgi:hypothetical protein
LNNTSNAGLWYVNGNNTLGNTNWNIGSRQSGFGISEHFRHVYRTVARDGCGKPAQRSEMALRPPG